MTDTRIPLTYDYAAERADDLAYAKRLQAERDAKKTPLQLAGERLDTALSIHLMYASDDRGIVSEAEYGRAEAELAEARAAYIAMVLDATGEVESDIRRRVAA